MTIAVGQQFPDVQLTEFIAEETPGCAVGPQPVQSAQALKGKTVAVFTLPGAFTPTCSAQHVPGFIAHAETLRARGIDEVWCVSVNDAFVMNAWGTQLGTQGVVRMIGDGNGELARTLGIALDLTGRGMGVRLSRALMLVKDGRVAHLAVEAPGRFEVSSAEALLAYLDAQA